MGRTWDCRKGMQGAVALDPVRRRKHRRPKAEERNEPQPVERGGGFQGVRGTENTRERGEGFQVVGGRYYR